MAVNRRSFMLGTVGVGAFCWESVPGYDRAIMAARTASISAP
jgi:hypothetical protein